MSATKRYYSAKVFSLDDSRKLDDAINDWLDTYSFSDSGYQIEIIQMVQSETSASDEFYHITLTVLYWLYIEEE